MNPEMMRQMMERVASARAADTGRRAMPFDGNMPEMRNMPFYGDMPGRMQLPQDVDEMPGNPAGVDRRYQGDDPDLAAYREMMERTLRNRQGGEETPAKQSPVLRRSTAGNMDRAMADRAREMALRAAMQRILTSEDIPPSPTR